MKNHKNRPGIMKKQPGTIKADLELCITIKPIRNREKPAWNHEKPTWNHENRPGTMKKP